MKYELDLIIEEATSPTCDPARSLVYVLDLLDRANLHEQYDLDDDETYASISDAQAKLFVLATDWKMRKSE